MKIISGGICAVEGVLAGGLKEGRNGLALIAAEGNIAGVFTRNKIKAAPLVLTKEVVRGGKVSAIVANSGCANAYTGERGIKDARKMAEIAAGKLGVDAKRVAVASTGVIGKFLDLQLIKSQIDRTSVSSSPGAAESAARAIMTTDTRPKQFSVEVSGAHIGGMAKGAGMISPSLATMISFIFTDASFSPPELQNALEKAVDISFNMISVDGDTSTNDTVLLVSTNRKKISQAKFQSALNHVCVSLAKMIPQDGEGATKFIECRIRSAKNDTDARKAAKAVINSPLVKTAFFGADPNWGRIVSALGKSSAALNPERLTLKLSDGKNVVILVETGKATGRLEEAKKIMESKEIAITVDLGVGKGEATAWGCDLSYDYVKINAGYLTGRT